MKTECVQQSSYGKCTKYVKEYLTFIDINDLFLEFSFHPTIFYLLTV